MKIIGFNLTRISIDKKEQLESDIQITQDIDIKNIKKEEIPFSKHEAIKVRFNFSIHYSKEIAKVEFEGNVILLPDKSELKEILESWKQKKIPESIRVGLFNFIMNKCNVKAMSLEDELGLPLHIPMPRVNTNQEPDSKPK